MWESIYNILGGCLRAVTEYIHEVESMLELKNISFGIDDEGGQKEIIRDISLTIKEKQFVVITGPNGGVPWSADRVGSALVSLFTLALFLPRFVVAVMVTSPGL